MVPTTDILDALQTLLNEDVATLAAAAVKRVHLIMAPFTPGADTDFTLLTEATFTGGGNKTAPAGNQQAFVDSSNRQRVVQLIEPLGGWHWVAADAVNLPQTIYGYAVTDAASAVTYGSALLDDPITLIAAGDAVDIDNVRFEFVLPVLE